MHEVDHDVIVVGGGIAGLATAVALVRRGITNIVVYEKAFQLHPVGAAIGLFPNGFAALEGIAPNVARKCRESSIQHEITRMMDAATGELMKETDMKKLSIVSPTYLVWYLLQQYLAEELETLTKDTNTVVLRLGHTVESYQVDEKSGLMTVTVKSRTEGSVAEQRTCRVLVGADGIHSTIRTQMHHKEHPKNFHGKLMFRAVLDMDILDPGTLPTEGYQLAFQGDVKGKLFAVRETAKGIVTFTSMAVFDNPNPDQLLMSDATARKERLQTLFQDYPLTVRHVLDRVPAEAIYENVVYDIDILPEWSSGRVVLIGDASHAMTPGLGQGANQGLEDACELAHSLAVALNKGNEDEESTIAQVLQDFWRLRLHRVSEIHAASRARTHQINQSDKNSRLMERFRDPSFMDMIYQWKPSFVVSSEES